jgi:hypothetical protein
MEDKMEGRTEVISGEFNAQDIARQIKEQHRGCGRVVSGVRRALSLFDVQVASWWDLDGAVAS